MSPDVKSLHRRGYYGDGDEDDEMCVYVYGGNPRWWFMGGRLVDRRLTDFGKRETANRLGGGDGMNVNPFNRSQIREMIRTRFDALKGFLTRRILSHFSLYLSANTTYYTELHVIIIIHLDFDMSTTHIKYRNIVSRIFSYSAVFHDNNITVFTRVYFRNTNI